MLRELYVACPLAHVEMARSASILLKSLGFIIVSRWHDYNHENKEGPSFEVALEENYQDLDRASWIVVLTFEDHGRETYVEVGRAVAHKKRVFWINHGGPSLTLLAHPLVKKISSPDDLKAIADALDTFHESL